MYLDSANIADTHKYYNLGIIKGITTNPTLIKTAQAERFSLLQEIKVTKLKEQQIFVQLIGDSYDTLLKDFHDINANIRCNDDEAQLGIKIPINLTGLKIVRHLQQEHPQISLLGTAIYSAEQAILAGIAGCHFVAPYINRMENNGIDPFSVITTVRQYYDNHDIKCQIMGASFKNTRQIIQALNAGAHTCTIPPDLLEKMLEFDVVNHAIEVFNNDGKI